VTLRKPQGRWARCAAGALVFALFGCNRQPAELGEPGGKAGVGVAGVKERTKAMSQLRNIGLAYAAALASGRPPKNLDDLKEWTESNQAIFQAPRDRQPFEIAWSVDPGKLTSPSTETLLAWEKTADDSGGRCALMADCSTVKHLTRDEFDKAPRAKGN
jgi:hypothetical protein